MVGSWPCLHLLPACRSKVITADQAVGAVLRRGKQSQTILVLSKADLVTDAKLDVQIVDRLLGEDEEFTRYGFRGCIATRCRDQKLVRLNGAVVDSETKELDEWEGDEDRWANALVKKAAKLTKRPAAQQRALRDNLTVRKVQAAGAGQ
jgi:hypothetical protein